MYSSNTLAGTPLLFNSNKKLGFPSNCVYDIFVDAKGVRWYATDLGLYAHNGFVFEKMPLQGAKSNAVTNLLAGKKGGFWCRNFSSQVFRRAGNAMVHLKALDQLIQGVPIIDMFMDNDQLVVVTEQRIIWINESSPQQIHTMVFTDNQLIQSACLYRGAVYLTFNSTKIARVSAEKKLDYIPVHTITGIGVRRLVKNENYLFLVVKKSNHIEVFRYDTKSNFVLFKRIQTQERILNCTVEQNILAILTNNGAMLVEDEKTLQILQTGARMSDFCIDATGTMLFSSLDNGLYEASAFTGEVAYRSSTSHFDILYNLNNQYLLASDNADALWKFDQTLTKKELLVKKSSSNIQFIAFDPILNHIFYSGGIVGKSLHFYFGKLVAFTPTHILVGYHNGLYKIPRKWAFPKRADEQGNEALFFQNLEKFKVRGERVRHVMKTGTSVYAAFADSLIVYTVTGDELKPRKSWPVFGMNMVTDPQGTHWVATTNDGLWLIENDTLRIHALQEKDIIGSLNIRLVADQHWVALLTDKGINIFERKQNQIIRKNFIDLSKLLVYDLALFNHTFVLSTDMGLITMPTTANPKGTFHQMFLNQVRVDGMEVQGQKSVKIPYKFKSLTFDWTNISFDSGVEFFYQLAPIQEQVNPYKGESSSVSFYALQPGNYTFTLFSVAQGKKKVFQEFTFEVLKPWYLTGWFWILMVVVSVLLIWFTMRTMSNRLRKKQLYEEKLIVSQLRAIRSQMNPHFLYNALNSLQGMIYAGKINESALYVSKFSDFLRQVLTNSDKQILPLKTEIQSIRTYLEIELERFYDDFNFELMVDKNINLNDEVPTMIIQPFVENAIKHGLMNRSQKGRELLLKFTAPSEGILSIEIIDNGVGIEVSQKINEKRIDKPTSFATKAIEDRIHLMNQQGDFTVTYKIEEAFPGSSFVGTRVIIYIQSKKS